MKCVIIEDEPLAAERVREFAGRLPDLTIAATFDNAVPALRYLLATPVDLLFLDLHLGELSGIQLLELLRPDCAVIILTAYEQHALKGHELNVTDYLLKPFTFERFAQAVERARRQRLPPPEPSFLFIKTQYRLERVLFEELLYIEGARDYRRLHTTVGALKTLETFGELEKKLPVAQFVRVHKSYLVALAKIESLERDVLRLAGRRIPVSETYKKQLISRMNMR
ncbi:LytR/AlgR family response regulator transcription factor [Hymenobacter negativus]|uniref:Response regulator transcription factor n=1 Tax=Hymenobacter negativus TaxID=2795026 RepID=A0ABS3QLH6_9BACT|nr:LytTR family DNA-binding domain-containing protein [Hymenobacter negativus]MBO2012102.1 response regulator transcription factor [Hymenobacter negativus]